MNAVQVVGGAAGLLGPGSSRRVIVKYQPTLPHYPGVGGVKGEDAVGVEVRTPGRAAVCSVEDRAPVARYPRVVGARRVDGVEVGGRPADLRRPGGAAVVCMDNSPLIPHRPAVAGVVEKRVVEVRRDPGGAPVTGLENDGAPGGLVVRVRDVDPHHHGVGCVEDDNVLEELLVGPRPYNGPVGTAVSCSTDEAHLPYRVAVDGIEKVNPLHFGKHQRRDSGPVPYLLAGPVHAAVGRVPAAIAVGNKIRGG